MNRNRRSELLAVADESSVRGLAEEFLARKEIHDELQIISPPTVGMVMMQVREPVCKERFFLGEVVVVQAEVAIRGQRGWSMRAGTGRQAALAAAVLDACAELGGTFEEEVNELCRRTNELTEGSQAEEWEKLLRTEVRFEELD